MTRCLTVNYISPPPHSHPNPPTHHHQATTRPESWEETRQRAGQPANPDLVSKAEKEASGLVKILEMEGIKVVRPEEFHWDQMGAFKTPYFEEGGKRCCQKTA